MCRPRHNYCRDEHYETKMNKLHTHTIYIYKYIYINIYIYIYIYTHTYTYIYIYIPVVRICILKFVKSWKCIGPFPGNGDRDQDICLKIEIETHYLSYTTKTKTFQTDPREISTPGLGLKDPYCMPWTSWHRTAQNHRRPSFCGKFQNFYQLD